MKMKIQNLVMALFVVALIVSCSNGDDNDIPLTEETNILRVTLQNTINFLNVKTIGDAPLTDTGDYYEVNFKATQGTYLSFANMFAQSNDWFFATEDTGIKLWDNGTPKTGDISNYLRVFDAGTEEDEDFLNNFQNTIYTAPNQSAPNTGPADDDNTVRDTDRNILNYLSADLSYDNVSGEFTLRIVKANRESLHNPGFVTPGILVVHTQDYALFQEGTSLTNNGLESLAEDGSPQDNYEWFTEIGTTGAPLRLSSSYSIFSPGVVYTHQGDQTPFFTNGEVAIPNSGLEELAEDGNADIAYEFLNGLADVTAVKSNGPITPGNSISFEIEVSPGDRLNYATMLVSSNDWFISNNQAGIEIYDADGTIKTDFEVNKSYLYDSGTEIDQTVGLGNGQPMNGNLTVADDSNTLVRRVSEINDIQFGKGSISSAAGVTQKNEVRGGYNFIDIIIEVIN